VQFNKFQKQENNMLNKDFWRGERVLITGHTGFKGAWAWAWLNHLGAEVTGLSLPPETTPSLAHELGITKSKRSIIGDIRDPEVVKAAVKLSEPSIVLHMAAQALVRRSYRDPVETFDINVRGTLQLLQELRSSKGLNACLVVTSDKVYENDDRSKNFVEDDPLGGSDPYSASKSACEIATSSFARSFFGQHFQGDALGNVATARAGNVIGGGDWSEDRLVPDLWRARRAGTQVVLRHPDSVRPWQHVLEPLSGYFRFLEVLSSGAIIPSLNFGPDDPTPVTVRNVADQFAASYGGENKSNWVLAEGEQPKEAKTLAIDPAKAKRTLNWHPVLTPTEAIEWTANWYAGFDGGKSATKLTMDQIEKFENYNRTSAL
jgi:CDP-glucose 4,6-dehydratase